VGGLGQDRGEFWLPAGIYISADDTIYVADAYNRRVQVFRYVGGAT
jgi:DNA-binding beta-propeller fold protein YncE